MPRPSSSRTAGVATGAVVVLLAAGCGGGGDFTPTMSGYEIGNAKDALIEVDGAFHKAAEDSNASVSKDSRCYFRVLTASNVDDQVWCGPVRHLGSTGAAVWDTFNVQGDPTGEKTVAVRGVGSPKTDQVLPATAKLRRTDGEIPPAHPEKIAPPPAPAADPAFTQLSADDLSGAQLKPLTGARLIGPGLSVTVGSAGPVTAIGAGADTKVAASGEQLWAAKLSFAAGPSSPDPNLDGFGSEKIKVEPKLLVITGQDRRSLDISQYVQSFQDSSGDTTLIVSVPKANGSPQLGLETGGQEQTLSLGDGTRGGYDASVFYRSNTVANVARQYANATVTTGDFTGNISFFVDKVYLTAFDETALGWAPPGKAWLEVPCTSWNSNDSSYPYDRKWADSSWTAVGADGTKYPYQPKGGAHGTEVFEVPADLTSATITLAPTQTYTLSSSAFTDTKPSSGTAHYPGLTFPVSFPAS